MRLPLALLALIVMPTAVAAEPLTVHSLLDWERREMPRAQALAGQHAHVEVWARNEEGSAAWSSDNPQWVTATRNGRPSRSIPLDGNLARQHPELKKLPHFTLAQLLREIISEGSRFEYDPSVTISRLDSGSRILYDINRGGDRVLIYVDSRLLLPTEVHAFRSGKQTLSVRYQLLF